MESSVPKTKSGFSERSNRTLQLLPLLCCLAIQAMWLVVIHSLEGLIPAETGRPPQLGPAMKL